jgi:F-type H+-transporting ATPase subunit epsilon
MDEMMRLRVLLPTQVLVDTETAAIVAEAPDGSFCLLPRHVDYVTALVAGLLRFTNHDGDDEYIALSGGILVKQGREVWVSTTDAVHGGELGRLQELVSARFATLDAREERTRGALARLEADFVRRFIELREDH